MYELQDDVPVPTTVRPSASARRKYPFEEMVIGQMFFVPNRSKNTLTTHVSGVGKQLNRKFLTRLTFMKMDKAGKWHLAKPTDKGAVQGIGVWRTE